ncbi:MAG: YfgM family protein [Desulfatibacillaceae bacterium]
MAKSPGKISRKQLKEPDEFQTFTAKIITYMVEHRRQLYTVAGVITFLVVAGLFLNYFMARTERKAHEMASQAEALYINYLAGAENRPELSTIVERFEDVVREYPRTDAGRSAKLYLAQVYMREGEYEKAVRHYEEVLDRFGGDEDLAKVAAIGLAYAHEQRKEYEKAAEYFRKLAEAEDKAFKEDATLGLARTYEAMGRTEDAYRVYRDFVERYPESVYVQLIREKLPPDALGMS